MAAIAYDFNGAERSLEIYQIAINVAERLKDKKRLATTYYHVGKVYAGIDRIKDAIAVYIKSRDIFEEAGLLWDSVYVLSGLGSFHLYLQNYEQARTYAEQSIRLTEMLKGADIPAGALPKDAGLASALSTFGGLKEYEGNYVDAIRYFEESLNIYKKIDKGSLKFGFQIAGNIASIGRVHNANGDNVKALIYLQQALEISRRFSYINIIISVLNNLGNLYLEQEDYEKAAYYYTQSLQANQNLRNQTDFSRGVLNLGVVEQRRGNYDQAVEKFEMSLRQAAEIPNKDVIIAAKEGIGAIYRIKGNYTGALEVLESGLALARELEDKLRIAELLWRKAEVFYDIGNYSEAETVAEESLRLAQQLRFFNLSYYTTTLLGKIQLAQKKSNLAFQTLSEAIEQVEEMRGRVVGQEPEQQLFFENKLAPHHMLVELLVKENKTFDALLYAEKAKGRVLLDVLRHGRVQPTNGMTKEEVEEERSLKQLIVNLNSQLREEQTMASPDAGRVQRLREQLETARLKRASFENVLSASHLKSKRPQERMPALTMERLSSLSESSETAFVEYVVTNNQVYSFVLTKEGRERNPDLRVEAIAVNEEILVGMVKKVHQSLAQQSLVFSASSRELYDLLLKPLEPYLRGKSTVCLIPDGILWDVPFQALLSGAGRYLIEDYSIYYAPSLSTLMEMRQRRREVSHVARGSLLAFGNPAIGTELVRQLREQRRGELFEPLPDAEVEVKTMARMFGPGRSKVFVGGAASERTFKSLGANFKTIHFATHGILDNHNPLYSYLLLSKSEGDVNEDGLLEAREIMELDLPAELAVLSACETARGKIGAGEGVIGMSWALFMAGCSTTVVSQWKVDSASTAGLMVGFYRTLLGLSGQKKRTKAEALREAALKVMKDRRYRHPFYWAGFVLIGSNN